jgi:hypothetical protein
MLPVTGIGVSKITISATAPGNGLELACLPKRSPVSERRYEETHTGNETSHYRRQRTWLSGHPAAII